MKNISERENYLRALEFRSPEWIPCAVHFSPLTRKRYSKELKKIISRHPLIFPENKIEDLDFDEFPHVYREGEHYRDNWGCLWYNIQEGLEGQVVEHPLSDWSALDTYKTP